MTYNASKMTQIVDIKVFSHTPNRTGNDWKLDENYTDLYTNIWAEVKQVGVATFDVKNDAKGTVNNNTGVTHTVRIRKKNDITINQWVFWRDHRLHIVGFDVDRTDSNDYEILQCTVKRKV